MERRFSKNKVAIEQRAGEQPTIKGTASVSYQPGDHGTEYGLWEGTVERIMPGAFDRHLGTGPDVIACFNHDPSLLLGRTPDTLKLRADGSGLHHEIQPDDTTVAKDVLKMIRRGDVRGSSFAFLPVKVQWKQDGNTEVWEIHEAQLFDVSPVTSPAYGATSVGVRSEDRRTLERERDDYRASLETERVLQRWEEINKA